MEKIYSPTSFRSSEHILLKEYFMEYSKVCDLSSNKFKSRKKKYLKVLQEMGVNLNASEFQEMENVCSLEKLAIKDEPISLPTDIPEKLQTKTKLNFVYPIKNSGKNLKVVMCKEILEKKYNSTTDFKFGNKRFLKASVVSTESVIGDIMPGSNFIYTIIVYRPYSINYGQRNSAEKLRFAYEIEALGTSTLAQLADTIVCLANIALFKEVENTDVDLAPLMNAKEHYPSQSIFIDGVFYNDTRSPKAIDYSTKIIQWADEKNIGKFKSDIMEKTLLNSLTPRMGYPYVFMHQGNCEHIFTFSDARLIQTGDCLNSKKYPRIVSLSRTTNIICYICCVSHSQWIVMKCPKFPQEKVFLCTACCNSYLFVDGKKVVDFNLYPYYDEELLTKHLNETEID